MFSPRKNTNTYEQVDEEDLEFVNQLYFELLRQEEEDKKEEEARKKEEKEKENEKKEKCSN